jgi:RNA polymerase sigma-70 factor (ECF subfamily)
MEAGQRPDSRLMQEAVGGARQGDMEAVHFLYVRYAQDVLRCVGGFVRDPDEARDITQGVFAELTETIGGYEQRDIPFMAWILRVARNTALDHVRARGTIPIEDARVADAGHARVGL